MNEPASEPASEPAAHAPIQYTPCVLTSSLFGSKLNSQVGFAVSQTLDEDLVG